MSLALPGAIALAASASQTAVANVLPTGPVAPEIKSDTWINTKPITWKSLRGKVVMVEFWTYG
jgi:hypothetical protein